MPAASNGATTGLGGRGMGFLYRIGSPIVRPCGASDGDPQPSDGYLHYVVMRRHVQRFPEADVTDAMRGEMKRSGGGLKWSGLVSVELATGKIHRAYSGQDRAVNTVVADGLCFTDLGIYDIRDPTAARYLGDFTIQQGKRTVQLDQVGQGRGDFQLRGGGWVTPAYVGGRLYVRGFSPKEGCHRLFCLDFRR